MKDDSIDAPRPVPVPPAVHDLIRQVAPERVDSVHSTTRNLVIEGRVWQVEIVGETIVGEGALGATYLDIISFRPDHDGAGGRKLVPREVYLPRGRFEFLYEEELVELFRSARPLRSEGQG